MPLNFGHFNKCYTLHCQLQQLLRGDQLLSQRPKGISNVTIVLF